MLRDRFLCRVFSKEDSRFLLKGGAGMLARIPDARATKDVDFAMRERESTESALRALNELSSKDLGDYCTFRLTNWRESLDENGYSRLLKLRYASYVGDEEKDPILIDLSLDCTTTQPAERVTPVNRIEIEGVAVFDYLAYPLADQLADKLCAVMELQPGGWPTSRMKDLVDIVTYATNEVFDCMQLALAIRSECAKRSMVVPAHFEAPESWSARFALFASRNGLPAEYADFEAASELASSFFDPALAEATAIDATWDPAKTEWVGACQLEELPCVLMRVWDGASNCFEAPS
ncbi:nucleotidyl transferase AbiEii/AbiGii toxin family protein [Eggerthellaceae bacterium zg-893]|nr:nucleotidyl transferase AbiEii/AbiGii toxin family protein [Eggerthellaceae bacterium zg-893]